MESNPATAVISLFLLLQLGGALALLLGGLYVLYCFNRAATSAERMADAAEAWLALQHYQVARNDQNQTPEPNYSAPNPPIPTEQTVVIAKATPPLVPIVPAPQTPNL